MVKTTVKSLQITEFSWGVTKVAGYETPFKDVKLYPGGARGWDWNETGTRHEPGIQPADVEELLTHGATVIVLSKGVHERLKTCPETVAMLEAKGVAFHILQTEAAIRRYNELAGQGELVGALIHSTC